MSKAQENFYFSVHHPFKRAAIRLLFCWVFRE